MTENRASEVQIERLRAELIEAEAELGQASTAASRRRCLDRYEQALARYSAFTMRHSLPVLSRDGGRQ